MSETDRRAMVFELRAEDFSTVQRNVLSSYCRAFARRHLFIRPEPNPGLDPYLFAGGEPLVDEGPACYWNWGDNRVVDAHGEGCAWVWHHGPTKELFAGSDPRVILLPRNDLFDIRGIEGTPEGWSRYRARIGSPWADKRAQLYFRGHYAGLGRLENPRVHACRLVECSGLPADVGLLRDSTPPELHAQVPIKDEDPLGAMGDYRFVLSLWGNHPFNPRLYRGLEAGSLVFHQATPTIRFLEDGVLVPGEHYVEIAPDLCDLVEKVDYFMGHPSEAREVAEAGHSVWMETLFVSTPFTIPDVIWERFTSQPHWRDFRDTFAVG